MKSQPWKWRHGDARARLYFRWAEMKYRATRVRRGDYGGMGICDEWMQYPAFKAWAEANGYEESLQIDRIDNSKGYSPDNCRWVTRSQNQNNRRTTRRFSAFGETKAVGEWAQDPRCVVKANTLRQRVFHCKWAPERALTVPVGAPC